MQVAVRSGWGVLALALVTVSACASPGPVEAYLDLGPPESVDWTAVRAPATSETPQASCADLNELIDVLALAPRHGADAWRARPVAFGAPIDEAEQSDAPAKKSGGADAARASQNPVADVVILPFEYAVNRDAGPRDNTQQVLTLKPVYPQQIDDEWNWIHRTLIPLIDQPPLSEDSYGRSGLGDITYQGFLSPRDPQGGLIWGVGPQLGLPSATDDVLGTDQWTVGPNVVGLISEGPWMAGTLLANAWTFASNDTDRDRVRIGTIQPLVYYNMDDGWFLGSTPLITAKWSADKSGDVWTVPVGVGFGRNFLVGKTPVSLSLRPYYNVHRPDEAARWQVIVDLRIIFPQ
jgi:hypothetical protein